ncbi:DEAD/DEAH box helicase [Furfurilactobacillus curtus]|uniref:DNA/RNA helicase n=1 Tax=Furfurilactobacillus curtus TaxID=1746200 RepID=A0ABQ5JNP9_9LACO
MQAGLLYGRQLTAIDLPQDADVTRFNHRPSMIEHGRWIICQRCHERSLKQQVRLPAGGYYCPACFLLGAVHSQQPLFSLPEPNYFTPVAQPLSWRGTLTRLQKQCATQINDVFRQNQQHLLWAVTGAGKTEMLFLGLADAIRMGKRVAIASPRVDVCLELYPRLQAAFTEVPIALLYGHQTEPYQYRQVTICTTHQLLRFYHAFDVLIVDEVDAFPFAQNPRLGFAVQQAVKPQSALLYLTATPSRQLLWEVHRGKLSISYLPLRFHGHLLPEIRLRLALRWRANLKRGKLPRQLLMAIKQCCEQHRRFLLFVPHVSQLAPIAAVIRQKLPMAEFATVHASDEQRAVKVVQMREQKLDFLITTTILERGVTLPEIDVFVLGADDDVFSSAALVQMAGRAGRSAKDPTGRVIFWIAEQTLALKRARQQIRLVNRKGRRLPECQSA